jgi:hypothetical protein
MVILLVDRFSYNKYRYYVYIIANANIAKYAYHIRLLGKHTCHVDRIRSKRNYALMNDLRNNPFS